ncbi:AtuA-related protein [Microbacterium rhizosphaerae]|uniref:AtuA-like ferredoxin-fold domain-containing protein n=1 Tax=Microbacterium rhizosphaerae TaxID=1678237 RepID=A0ABZ0SQ39_9MICO|nr:hypothetical protein [Microbacterium rhizosphaerae]WPR89362.1 hypothetical protein SM116_16615 [Microbacterium rhizosphaerae]
MIQLHEVAHARAGDKGNTSIIMVAPYIPDDYERIAAALTPARVATHFGVPLANVTIHAAATLRAFTIVIRERLDGGVTRSRGADPHGKTLSGHLLELSVPD